MLNQFNVVDLIFIIFSLIFVATALFRGLIKEVFAFCNWVIAFTLSYFLAPYLAEFLKNHVKSKIAVDLSARGIIFLVVFITIAISTSGLSKSLRDATPRALDRSLGLIFAIFKTLIIFGCVYSIYANMYGFLLGNKLLNKEDIQDPKILTEAKTYNTIKTWGNFVDPVVKLFFDAISKNIEFAISKSMELEDKMNQQNIDKSLNENQLKEQENLMINPQDLDNKIKQLEGQIDPAIDRKDQDKMNQLIDKIEKK
jgi:uncharacterized membrane protein required for colicin V production